MKESGDLLKGAKGAAKALGLTPREIYYLLDQDLIPGRKIGGRWYFSRHELFDSFGAEPPCADATQVSQPVKEDFDTEVPRVWL